MYEHEMFSRFYDLNNFCDKVYNENITSFRKWRPYINDNIQSDI